MLFELRATNETRHYEMEMQSCFYASQIVVNRPRWIQIGVPSQWWERNYKMTCPYTGKSVKSKTKKEEQMIKKKTGANPLSNWSIDELCLPTFNKNISTRHVHTM